MISLNDGSATPPTSTHTNAIKEGPLESHYSGAPRSLMITTYAIKLAHSAE